MEAVLAAVIAVVGTLLGSASTYLFQRANAARVERTARAEARRQERLATYAEFAAAATVVRRACNDRWHRHREDPAGAAFVAARDESYRALSAARVARTKLRLLTDAAGPVDLVELADRSVDEAWKISRAGSAPEREGLNDSAKAALDAFLTAAAAHLR